jgi:hypothetical protein
VHTFIHFQAEVDTYGIVAGTSSADHMIGGDRRYNAAAGLKVLGELAHKTQVIFFTHHRHLIDVAEAALNTNVSVINLAEPPLLPADTDTESHMPLQRQAANA